jgi:hypothetical protein
MENELAMQLHSLEYEDCLKEWVDLNRDHLHIRPTGDVHEDIELIHIVTKMKFRESIALMIKFSAGESDGDSNESLCIRNYRPFILPNVKCVLNEHDERISLTPPGFKGKLYPPQASLIKRMLEVEDGMI